MKIAFVVNDVQTELAAYTTTRLAMAAANMGHKSFLFGVGDFVCAADGSLHARARTPRGKNVFLIGPEERANLNQMIDAVLRDGYCVAQEYLPAAAEGDVRLFVMNGRPLTRDGKYAAFRRINKSGDARSNMHSGGESEPVEVTDDMLRLVQVVRPKLMSDGMFLVGLDIVADKIIEVNVFSPGGLGSSSEFSGVDFARTVIEDLQRKVEFRKYYDGRMTNVDLATL